MGFKDNVLQILEYKRLTQSDLAVMLRKTPQNISMVLKKDSPSNNTVNEFAKALEVDPSELLENEALNFAGLIKSTKNKNTPYTRLFDYIQAKSLHPDDVSEKLKIPYMKLYNSAVKGHDMSNSVIKSLQNLSDLNITWLLTGEGEMFTDSGGVIDWNSQVDNPKEFFERLWKFLLQRKITLYDLKEKTDFNVDIIGAGLEGKVGAGAYEALLISDGFPELNPIWLLSGKGEMIKREYQESVPTKGKIVKVLSQEHANDFVVLRDSKFLITTPLITHETQRDYVNNLENLEFIDELEFHAIITDRLQAGIYRSFEVVGNHMMSGQREGIADGSIVTGYRIDGKISGRRLGLSFSNESNFVIVTKKEVKITTILEFDSEKQEVICQDTNPTNKEKLRFAVEDIVELYAIVVVTQYRGDWLPGRVLKQNNDFYED